MLLHLGQLAIQILLVLLPEVLEDLVLRKHLIEVILRVKYLSLYVLDSGVALFQLWAPLF